MYINFVNPCCDAAIAGKLQYMASSGQVYAGKNAVLVSYEPASAGKKAA